MPAAIGSVHLAGLIDNLADDPQLTTRARASIQGEVVRRQRLLKMADSAPSITLYRQLRVQRRDLPPMPHLFVVIDEFGELLTAEPEFIDLFLQIGRIGRSIGVHLLLSSQRLEGGKLRGLDSYLSYRLGMRTFSESESQAMLNTTDAYHLPALPGYGFLKVDTTVYTRFRAGFVSRSGRAHGLRPGQWIRPPAAAADVQRHRPRGRPTTTIRSSTFFRPDSAPDPDRAVRGPVAVRRARRPAGVVAATAEPARPRSRDRF